MIYTRTRAADSARRRMDFYHLASRVAIAGLSQRAALSALTRLRDRSPVGDPSRAWSDAELSEMAARIYAVDNRWLEVTGAAGPAQRSEGSPV